MSKPSYLDFDRATYHWQADIDYRRDRNQYRVGKGEQGVLICEPYKSEIVPYWHFKNEEIALISSARIYDMFLKYLQSGDFVGADMARKFLQMGFTRARRYANYKGGRKYDKENNYCLNAKGTGDPEKARSAEIFFRKWAQAEKNADYAKMKRDWRTRLG